ncbi:early nodulin-like protein 1 [Phoenix dactylifera]|uniref:Early nodulin-like protein 1 n=1 Tax=Phoenix dactylifera TaxID=42345 RepID=A0A8B7CTP7_PHODC|nr:early nodulin-like protein 1 [Phoenix dactylifera]
MALLMSFTKRLLLTLLFSMLHSNAFDFEVGDEEGWAVPPSRNTKLYNHWASRNRFQVGDTIHFKYKKDSVMEVSEEDYEHCRSSHPIFFSNDGRTEFDLDHSGTLYFISGAAGHCERGQKMIIKVLSHPHSEGPSGSQSSSNQTAGSSTSPESPDSSGAAQATASVLEVIGLLVSLLFF